MAWRLARHDHPDRLSALIHRLMLLAGRYFDSLTCLDDEIVIFDFQIQYTFENEEKLARVDMRMASFFRPGRHQFFDNAEFRSLHQVPAVAVRPLRTSPFVMFGRFYADDLCWHSSPQR